MGWMTWKYGLNGFLYYDTTYAYGLHRNPWNDVYSFGTNGDGTLFYPGKPSIIGGKTEIPCFSLRLMLIRLSLPGYGTCGCSKHTARRRWQRRRSTPSCGHPITSTILPRRSSRSG